MLRASSSTTRTLLRRRQQQQTLSTDLSLLQSTTATSCCSNIRRGLIQRPLSSAGSSSVPLPFSDSTPTPRLYASNSYQTASASRCLIRCSSSSSASKLAVSPREVATGSNLLENSLNRKPQQQPQQQQQQLIVLPQLQQQLLIYSRLNILNNHNYNQQWHREFSTKAAQKSAVSSAASTVSSNLDSASDEKSEKNKKKASASVSGANVNGISSAPKQQDVKTTKASSSSSTSSPTKKASPSASSSSETSILQKATSFLQSALKTLISLILKTPGVIYFYLTHPTDLKAKLHELKEHAKHEANHYWMGSKLLAADVRTARHILGRTFRGSPLSRRERKQLLRTATDVFRLVPMSIFVLVPFMEFALPFALKIFPDMLPSTFRDGLKEEEKMKRELAMRISMAGFFRSEYMYSVYYFLCFDYLAD